MSFIYDFIDLIYFYLYFFIIFQYIFIYKFYLQFQSDYNQYHYLLKNSILIKISSILFIFILLKYDYILSLLFSNSLL